MRRIWLERVVAISWQDLRGSGRAELMNAEPYLLVGVQRVEVSLAIIAQRLEVIEKSAATVAIAELQVIANVCRFRQVVTVVPRCQLYRCLVSGPGLLDIVHHLVAGGSLSKTAGLRLVASAFLFALIPVEDSQRNRDLKARAVEDANTLIFTANRRIRCAIRIGQLHVCVRQTHGLLRSLIIRPSCQRLLLDLGQGLSKCGRIERAGYIEGVGGLFNT